MIDPPVVAKTNGAKRITLAGGAVALVLVQQLVTLGGSDLLGAALTNAGHIPLFAVLTMALLALLPRPDWRIVLAAAVVLAAGTELLQRFTGRNASLLDLVLDLLGVVPVLAAALAIRWLRRRRCSGAAIWMVCSATAALLLVMTAAGPLQVLRAYAARDAAFPELLLPADRAFRRLIQTDSALEVVSGPPGWPGYTGQPVIAVTWGGEQNAGVTLTDVVPSWQGFDTLVADVYVPGGTPMPLTLVVRQQGVKDPLLRLHLLAQPGRQRLRYDLSSLGAASGDGPPPVAGLTLRADRAQAGRRLLIGAVRLAAQPARAAGNTGNLGR